MSEAESRKGKTTYDRAKRGILPPACWFRPMASVYLTGCRTYAAAEAFSKHAPLAHVYGTRKFLSIAIDKGARLTARWPTPDNPTPFTKTLNEFLPQGLPRPTDPDWVRY